MARCLVLCNIPYSHTSTWCITFYRRLLVLCLFKYLGVWGRALFGGVSFFKFLAFFLVEDMFVILGSSFFVFLEVSSFSAIIALLLWPSGIPKDLFLSMVVHTSHILSLCCFICVQAFGNILKHNVVADLGSFQKSICIWMFRCGFRLELGLLKLC